MSEYQSDYEHLQSNRTNDALHQDTAESIQIIDNRTQSATQKTIQKMLGQFKQVQSADVLHKEEEEEEPLRGNFDNNTNVSQLETEPSKPNTTGLPDNLKSGVENLSGLSLDDVQVHYNSDKPTQLQALAYTQGTEIHVAPGQEQHLPHEAWHAVQQMQGRVQPTIEMNGGVQVNDDGALESEADVMGGRAV